MKTLVSKNLDIEIVKMIRGRRTQTSLSHRLGYSFNQMYLWETGRRTFYWEDFRALCESLSIPLTEKISLYFLFPSSTAIHTLLTTSLKFHKKTDVANILKISNSKLSRWLSGQSAPPFIEVLKILEITQLNFYEFLDDLVGKGKLLPIQDCIRKRQQLKDLLFQMPYSGAVAPALVTKKYMTLSKHKPGIIAKMIGITAEEETRALNALKEIGQIEWRDDKYRLKTYRINLRHEREYFRKNCEYWSQRAVQFKKKEGQQSGFGYRLFAMSQKGVERIRQAHIDHYNAITKIIDEENTSYDHVVAVNFHTMVLDEEN